MPGWVDPAAAPRGAPGPPSPPRGDAAAWRAAAPDRARRGRGAPGPAAPRVAPLPRRPARSVDRAPRARAPRRPAGPAARARRPAMTQTAPDPPPPADNPAGADRGRYR